MYKLGTLRRQGLNEDDRFYAQNRKTHVGARGRCHEIFHQTFKITVISVMMRACCLGNSAILKVPCVNGQLVTPKKITECDRTIGGWKRNGVLSSLINFDILPQYICSRYSARRRHVPFLRVNNTAFPEQVKHEF